MKYYLAMWENMYEGSMLLGALMLDLDEATIKRAQETAYKEEIVDMHDPESGAIPTGKWRKIIIAGGMLQYVWRNDVTGTDELCLTIREASII